jgi:TRAP-type C4-dicarboxylate transport system permease small subunit
MSDESNPTPDDLAVTNSVSNEEGAYAKRVEYMPGVFLTPRVTVPKYENVGMGIAYLADWVSITAILFLLGMTFLDVLLRTVFSHPLSGVYDWTRYLMVFVALFGMPLCAMNDEHVSVDILVKQFPDKVQTALSWMNYALVVFYLYILITENWKQAGFNATIGQSSAGVPWPTYPFYYFVSIAFACMLAVVVVKMINLARGVK